MQTDMLSIEQVRDFVQSREVELVLAPPSGGAELFLKASYDGEGFFFGIAFHEVDYVCMPGGCEARSLHLGQLDDLGKRFDEFRSLIGQYSGPALVVEADDDGPAEGGGKRYIIVADRIEITRGTDWPEV